MLTALLVLAACVLFFVLGWMVRPSGRAHPGGGFAFAAPLTAIVTGGRIMGYIVKADNPDVRYAIELPTPADSEGNPIPAAALSITDTVSDNPAAVTITPDDEQQLAGSVHFGKPNDDGSPAEANVTAKVMRSDTGQQVGTLSAHFTIPPGDVASYVGGGFRFEGLTETA